MNFIQKIFNKAPKFSELTPDQQKAVANRITRAVRAMAKASGAARYKVINAPDRELGYTERCNEDDVLSESKRGALLNMARNQVRNSSTMCALLKQFDLQTVGTVGGKASFVFEDGETSAKMREAFATWARDAEFFDGLSFSAFLKIVLKTYLIGGDMVIVFDDNLIEDSGRVVMFEPDEIGSLDDAEFQSRFGKLFYQSLGRVYNPNGRFTGVIVSRACRGEYPFKLNQSYVLEKNPNDTDFDCKWIMPRNVFRSSQGRGVPPVAAPLATIIDLEDLTNYELQAAKKNSQTVAQVLQDKDDAEAIPSAFDAGTDFSSMTPEEIADAVNEEAQMTEQVVTLDKIRGAGAIYEVMPEGKKLELLDTKHPNANMPEFIRWLAGRSAAPFGLGSVYATLKADASYTAFRGEQVMSQPAFEEAQKFLETICDWVLARWSVWADRKGIISASELPDGWHRKVVWQWPRMREVNQVDEQNAIALRLKNGTGSYADVYGADWREKLAAIGKEIEFCKEHGLLHPALQTVSGMVIDPDDPTAGATNNKGK